MRDNKTSDRFVGHSSESSLGGALQDAVNQALTNHNIADIMVEYEMVKVWGRAGGIAGFRDIWVEISVSDPEKDKGKDKEEPGKYTTMAVGEEGGLDEVGPGQVHHSKPPYTTLAVGEEGGQT